MLENYPQYEYYLAATQLVLAMLGMGALLQPKDFLAVVRRPQGVGLGLLILWLLVPLLAAGTATLFRLPQGIAVGLVLVAAMPTGTLSNVFVHLGRGHVVLCIAITVVSTFACLVMTPLVLRGFAAAHLPADFEMPAGRVVSEILFFLLVPLGVGMAIGRAIPDRRERFSKWSVRGSLVVLAGIVVGSLGSGRLELAAYGLKTPVVLVLFGIVVPLVAMVVARLARFNRADAFTMSLAALLRNANLAVLVTASLFPATKEEPDPIGGGMLFTALFYGGAALVIAVPALLSHRRARGRQLARDQAGEGVREVASEEEE